MHALHNKHGYPFCVCVCVCVCVCMCFVHACVCMCFVRACARVCVSFVLFVPLPLALTHHALPPPPLPSSLFNPAPDTVRIACCLLLRIQAPHLWRTATDPQRSPPCQPCAVFPPNVGPLHSQSHCTRLKSISTCKNKQEQKKKKEKGNQT